ncbi:MAG: SNF2-related protein, partial [Candidatus Methylomirabilota bacterium]
MFELILTPAGRLSLGTGGSREEAGPSAALEEAARAFALHPAAGLVALAAARVEPSWSPACLYWRDFAARYLSAFCQAAPDAGAAIEPLPPPPAELATWLLRVPPMPGAEYVSPAVLAAIWTELDAWVRQEATTCGGVAEFLAKRAPRWHQVGRVCLHLAENRRDPEYPFAFLATYTTGMGRGARIQHQPLSRALEEFAGAKNKAALVRLLAPLQRASERSALVRELVESRDIYHPLAWTAREAHGLLKEIPALEAAGLTVRVPDWWARRPRPLVRVTLGGKSRQGLGAEALLAFRVGMVLEDQAISEAEWQSLLAAQDGLVWLKGQWVEVDREKLAQALAHWKQVEREAASGGLSFFEGMRLLAGAPTDLRAQPAETEARPWTVVEAGGQLREMLARLRDPGAYAPPEAVALHGTLRPYQRTGAGWLGFLSGLGLGACLADDMGLGKTLQVLALLLARVRERPSAPSVVVLPASLLSNWRAEIGRFASELKALYLHPSELDRAALAVARETVGRYDVVLTTYGMLTRSPWLLEASWDLAILDEAQAIKNPSARQTRAVKALKSQARIALTGTPVENRLGDLWSLFDFLNPGLLGGATRFRDFVRGLGR